MTTHYIATYDGCTFKRSTANRTYTQMVIVRNDIAQCRIEMEKAARNTFARDFDWYTQMARGYWVYNGKNTPFSAEEIAEGKALVAGGVEKYVESRLADFDATMRKIPNKSSDGKSYYSDAGWCGRYDLAHKLAARYTGGPRTRASAHPIILNVEVSAKAPKIKKAAKAHHILVSA